MKEQQRFFRPHLAFGGAHGVASSSVHGSFPGDSHGGGTGSGEDGLGVQTGGRAGGAVKGAPPALTTAQQQQFRELMLPHLDAAYNFARFLTRDATAAEDIVQESFLRAYRAYPNYRGDGAKTWLMSIIRNQFLDWASANRNWRETLIDEGALTQAESAALSNIADPEQDDPEQSLLRSRKTVAVRRAIESLPEPFRETLILREMEDLSYKHIATLTGTPIGTVMSRLARARQLLCEILLHERDPGSGRRGDKS